MRNVFYFILLSVAVFGLRTTSVNPIVGILVFAGLVAWFIYGISKRDKVKKMKNENEIMFNQFLKEQMSKNKRY